MELNREQIIKALECCYMQELEHNENCPECPYTDTYPKCQEHVGKSALSLIKELTEENERLRELGTTKEIEKEIVRRETKADTVSELQTRVAMCYGTYTDKDMTSIAEVFKLLDQIAKEMLEGT